MATVFFGEKTFSPEVQGQIKVRQKIVGDDTVRESLLLSYLAKTGWVSLSSFVTITDENLQKRLGIGTGDELAQKIILRNGISSFTPKEAGKSGGVISDKLGGIGGDKTYGNSFLSKGPIEKFPLGVRPMPGITSIDIKSKGTYGSLLEADISFICWDLNQLEKLEPLFMRPGYSVLLEWGWSQYISNDEKINQATSLIPIFGNPTDISVQKSITQIRTTTNGNRDGMLGLIKNFSWKFRDDGGYDCKLTMISRGEIVEGIPASTNNYSLQLAKIDDSPAGYIKNAINKPGQNKISEETGLTLTAGDFISDLFASLIYLQAENEDTFKNILSENSQIEFEKLKKVVDDIVRPPDQDGSILFLNIEEGENFFNFPPDHMAFISFGKFIDLINKLLMIKSKQDKDNDIIKFEAIGSRAKVDHNQFAVDLRTCMIVNKSFDVYFEEKNIYLPSKYLNKTSLSENYNYFKLEEGEEYGDISSIFISIQTIFDSYVSHKDSILNLVTDILNKVNDNIGGINNFATHVNPENPTIVQIMDLNYLPPQARSPQANGSDLFGKKAGDFEIFNNKSILTNLEISSEIPSSMQTSISIGAQASNAGSPNSTNHNPYNAFNLGIKDRLVPNKETNNASKLKEILERYKTTGENLFKWFTWGEVLFKSSDNLSEVQSQLKDYINWVRGNTINHIESSQALIPLKLSFELEGISGIVIGERFTIPTNILPSSYKNKNGIIKVGFIVTEMGHKIDTKGWRTKIAGLMYMLQNEILQDITQDTITKDHPYYNFKTMIREIAYGSQGSSPGISEIKPAGAPGDGTIGGGLSSADKLTEQDLINAYIFYMLDNEGGVVAKSVEKKKKEVEEKAEEVKLDPITDKVLNLPGLDKTELLFVYKTDDENLTATKTFLKDNGFTQEEIDSISKDPDKFFKKVGDKAAANNR
jgi:hypothetical protein